MWAVWGGANARQREKSNLLADELARARQVEPSIFERWKRRRARRGTPTRTFGRVASSVRRAPPFCRKHVARCTPTLRRDSPARSPHMASLVIARIHPGRCAHAPPSPRRARSPLRAASRRTSPRRMGTGPAPGFSPDGHVATAVTTRSAATPRPSPWCPCPTASTRFSTSRVATTTTSCGGTNAASSSSSAPPTTDGRKIDEGPAGCAHARWSSGAQVVTVDFGVRSGPVPPTRRASTSRRPSSRTVAVSISAPTGVFWLWLNGKTRTPSAVDCESGVVLADSRRRPTTFRTRRVPDPTSRRSRLRADNALIRPRTGECCTGTRRTISLGDRFKRLEWSQGGTPSPRGYDERGRVLT